MLHKILREGHPNVLASSQRHKTLLQDLGRLWVLYLVKNIICCGIYCFPVKGNVELIKLIYHYLIGSSEGWLWKTYSTVLSIITC